MNNSENTIGIVGGLGHYAGIDLYKKILGHIMINGAHRHLSIALLSASRPKEEGTFYSYKKSSLVAMSIFNVLKRMDQMKIGVAGIACNAAHSPEIFDLILKKMKNANINIKLVNMVDEVAVFIRRKYPKIRNAGVLCTTDTFKSKIYETSFRAKGINVIFPNKVLQDAVNKAIYDSSYGIKVQADPPTRIAKCKLLKSVKYLQKKGAEAIVLGCTEIPLAITEKKIGKTFIIDPTLILARALIEKTNPEMLKQT